MSGQEEEHIGGGSPGRGEGEEASEGAVGNRKDDDARARVEDLSNSIAENTLTGGKSFNELPLYEKKSALIDRELE